MKSKMFVVLFSLSMILVLGGNALAADPLENGDVLEAGEIGVWEVVDHDNDSIIINYGDLEEDFAVAQDHNAWIAVDEADAHNGACQVARDRQADAANFAGYTVTVNGAAFVSFDDCMDVTVLGTDDENSSTGGSFTLPSREVEVSSELRLGETVKEVGQNPENVMFQAGSILVQRITDASQKIIYVDLIVLEEDTWIEVGPGERAVHIWYNYQSELYGSQGACREANSRFLETLTSGNWNYRYLVVLNDEQMTAPADCA